MIPYFPKQIANRAIIVYLASLAIVSVFYITYSMQLLFFALGISFVTGFFLLTSKWTMDLATMSDKLFARFLFMMALFIRVVFVIGSYIYYVQYTGSAFGYELGDAMGYHDTAEWLADSPWSMTFDYFFHTPGVPYSDSGYPIILTCIYKLFGPVVIIPRCFKALSSAWMCGLI